jgi:hypothetical protein
VCFTILAGEAGGAIYIGYRNSDIAFQNVTFLSNEAKEGGAVWVFSENAGIDFYLSSFYGNVARDGDGGAVFVSDGNQRISFAECLFEMNAAVKVGGCLGMNSVDGVSIDMCDFRNNSAEVAGEMNVIFFNPYQIQIFY